MTEDSKTSPLSEVSASITRIGHAIRPRVGAVAVNSNGRGVHADFEKLSASEFAMLIQCQSDSTQGKMEFPRGAEFASSTDRSTYFLPDQ